MKKYIIFGIASLFIVSTAYAADFTFSNDLRVGGRGQDVTELQSFLISSGYDIPSISSGAAQKGYFGFQTKSAVQRYQTALGVPSTGFVGPLTRGKLNNRGIISALSVISPNGGEVWKRNTTQTIKWNAPAYFRATYADITLQPFYNYPVCTGQICPMYAQSAMYPYRAPYTIAKNISIDSHSYSWNVSSYYQDDAPNSGASTPIPDGQYKIQICEMGTTNCALSNQPFTITSSSTTNLPPVINGIDAPTTLAVGQTGTWTVRATDPENGPLSYSVKWGDETGFDDNGIAVLPSSAYFAQTSTFAHTYSKAGNYTVIFTVQDNVSNQIQSSVTVNVVATLLRVCPSMKVNNLMPYAYHDGVATSSRPALSWFILNSQTRQLSEFDLDWVSKNCTVQEQNVY